MESITYKIEVFEGPMDLLLHLINKHKLNINDIPIVELVNQYLDYVRQMEQADFGKKLKNQLKKPGKSNTIYVSTRKRRVFLWQILKGFYPK